MLFLPKETEKSVKNEIVLHPPNSDARCTLINFFIFLVLFNNHLTHPLVLDLGDLGVGVAHHGDQQVQQQQVDHLHQSEVSSVSVT